MTMPAQPEPQTRLAVRVTPRASSNAVVRYVGDALYLRLMAPPVEGAANEACAEFVAGLLGLRPAQVSVVGGHKSRDKVLLVTGLRGEEVRERLTKCVPEPPPEQEPPGR